MAITPFIRPIKIQGGTFFTCSSASEDLNYTLDNSKRKFRFSNFSLLKIPQLKQLSVGTNADLLDANVAKPNYIQIDSPLGANQWYREDAPTAPTPNIQNNDAFIESFQNYYYNAEAIIAGDRNYDIELDRTISERVFFKWLKEIGAIRFRQALSDEVVPTSSGFGTRFAEENDTFDINGNPIYERVVKYMGNINVVNSIRHPQNSFTEIYIHVPTNHGGTKDILFDAISDNNYGPDKIYKTTNTGLDEEYVEGREYNEVHPVALDFHGHYDSNINAFDRCWYLNPDTETFIDSSSEFFKWWFEILNAEDNSFYSEPLSFSDVTNDVFAISWSGDPNTDPTCTKFIRNRLDGISLEFNPAVYQKIASSSIMQSFGDFNASHYANNFSFNTVLVYYDVYDIDNPADFTTNLFGILFLDNVDYISGSGGTISSLNKYKPNSLLQQNGNSYAFRLNIKFDVNASDAAVEVSINDYNTFSLQLYLDALTSMKDMAAKMDGFIQNYKSLSEEVNTLKDLIYSEQSIDELTTRIEDIETRIQDSEEVFLNNENLVTLLNKNYAEITNIYKNYTSIEMTYNLDSIKQGTGVEVARNDSGYVTINNTRQSFNIAPKSLIRIDEDFATSTTYSYSHQLIEYDNYLRIGDGSYNTPKTIDRDILFYIDDTNVKWQKGQRLRISFTYGLSMSNVNGNFNVILYSDAKDTLNTGYKFNAEVGIVTYDNFNENNSYKPIIEIICIDPDTYTFIIDTF
jgi:hypothetical protein